MQRKKKHSWSISSTIPRYSESVVTWATGTEVVLLLAIYRQDLAGRLFKIRTGRMVPDPNLRRILERWFFAARCYTRGCICLSNLGDVLINSNSRWHILFLLCWPDISWAFISYIGLSFCLISFRPLCQASLFFSLLDLPSFLRLAIL